MSTKTPPIEITEEFWPVVVARFHAAPTDDEHEAFLEAFSRLHTRGDIYSSVLVTMPNMPMTPPRQVRNTAKWIRRESDPLARLCAGTGFVLPSVVSRGVLRAVLYMQPLPNEHGVFKTEDEAVEWGHERVRFMRAKAAGA